MDEFKNRVDELLKLHHMTREDFCEEMDVTEDVLTDLLNHPESISNQQMILIAGLLGVTTNYLCGQSVFLPQISLSYEHTDNGYWGAIEIQISPSSPTIMKPISCINMEMVQAELNLCGEKPGVLVIPCMDNTVLFLRSDRFYRLSFYDLFSKALKKNRNAELMQSIVDNYSGLSLLREFLVQEDNAVNLFCPAISDHVMTKEDMARTLHNSNQVIATDGSAFTIDPDSTHQEDIVEFCFRNLNLYQYLKPSDFNMSWKGLRRILSIADSTESLYYHPFWPTYMEFLKMEFGSDAAYSVVNMKDVAMLQLYLPDIEENLFYRIHE